MRLVGLFALAVALLLSSTSAQAVWFSATWEKEGVDFDEAPRQVVETHIQMIAHCPTHAQWTVPTITLATIAPGVLFHLDGEEISQLDLIHFDWTFEPLPIPHWYVDETLEIEVARDPDVSQAIDTKQRWFRYSMVYGGFLNNCDIVEGLAIDPILYGDNVREYIHFKASALNSTELQTNGGQFETETLPAAPILAFTTLMLLTVAIARRREKRQ